MKLTVEGLRWSTHLVDEIEDLSDDFARIFVLDLHHGEEMVFHKRCGLGRHTDSLLIFLIKLVENRDDLFGLIGVADKE